MSIGLLLFAIRPFFFMVSTGTGLGKDRAGAVFWKHDTKKLHEGHKDSMFDEWKRAWDQAVENFERELHGNDNTASPSQKAHAMRRDLSAARTALNRLQADLAQARKDVAAEEESEQTARRRAEMAQRIDDNDTVRIALEFAERHAHRAGILRRKVDVLQEELTMRQEELASMEQQAAVEIEQIEARRVTDLLEKEKQDADFRRMERERKEKDAEARLEELKKRMR